MPIQEHLPREEQRELFRKLRNGCTEDKQAIRRRLIDYDFIDALPK